MPKFLKKLDRIMDVCESNIVGYATIIIAIIMFINVVLRNFFHSGLTWGNELSSYLNMLAVFVAAGAGFKYGAHVGVSAFVDYCVPKFLQRAVATITHTCVLVFTGLVFYQGWRMAALQFKQKQVSPVLHVPIGCLYVMLSVGMLTSTIRVIMEIAKLYAAPDAANSSAEIGKEEK